MFAQPYGVEFFSSYAEPIPGLNDSPPWNDSMFLAKQLSLIAKQNDLWLVGGSIAEQTDDGKIYNTCMVFDNEGILRAKHRKIHLFDVNVPNGISFQESAVLSPGESITVIDTPFCRFGVAICYDLRFPDLSKAMRERNAQLLIFPSAFNSTTGPLHWKLLLQSRAVDNQCYTIGVSPSANKTGSGYPSYGHTLACNPWGTVLCEADDLPQTLICEIDLDTIQVVRQSIPILSTPANYR